MTSQVFTSENVIVDRGGYNATPKSGASPESTHEDDDLANEAAVAAGGARWIINSVRGRQTSSDYVPVC